MTPALIAHVADLHFGAIDRTALEVFTAFAKDQPITGVAVAGDLTQRGSSREFRDFASWAEDMPAPIICVPGNHDTPLYNLESRVSKPFDRYRRHTNGFDSSGTLGGLNLFGLNTARGWQMRWNWAEGSVRPSDLTSLMEQADRAEQGVNTVLCHHPFLPPPNAPLRIKTRRGEWASQAIEKSAMGLLLAGHVHTPTAQWHGSDAKGYLAVTAGTLSTRLRYHPPSFNLIRLDNDHLGIEAILIQKNGKTESRTLGRWGRKLFFQNSTEDGQ